MFSSWQDVMWKEIRALISATLCNLKSRSFDVIWKDFVAISKFSYRNAATINVASYTLVSLVFFQCLCQRIYVRKPFMYSARSSWTQVGRNIVFPACPFVLLGTHAWTSVRATELLLKLILTWYRNCLFSRNMKAHHYFHKIRSICASPPPVHLFTSC